MEPTPAKDLIKEGMIKPKWLVTGHTGTGKTTALKTFPPDWKILVLDLFGNPEVLEGAPNIDVIRYSDLDPSGPTAWAEVDSDRRHMIDELYQGTFSYHVLVLDTLTGLGRFGMNYILAAHPSHRGIGGAPSEIHYRALSHIIFDYLSSILSFPICVVMNCHCLQMKDDLTGIIENEILVVGRQTRRTLGAYTSEIYRAFAQPSEDDPEKAEFLWQTLPDNNWPFLKSTLNQDQRYWGMYVAPDYKQLLERRGIHATQQKSG